jgi:hypothetical protein
MRVKALSMAVPFREGVTPLDVIQAASIEGSARIGSDSLLHMTQKSRKSGDQGVERGEAVSPLLQGFSRAAGMNFIRKLLQTTGLDAGAHGSGDAPHRRGSCCERGLLTTCKRPRGPSYGCGKPQTDRG